MTKNKWLFWALLLVVFFLLRIAVFPGIAAQDESTYVRFAAKVALGNFELPTVADPNHAILRYTVVVPLGLLYKVFGINDFSTVLMFAIYSFLSLVTFYYFVRSLYSVSMSRLSTLLLALYPTHVQVSFRAYADLPQIMFIFLSFGLFIRACNALSENPEQKFGVNIFSNPIWRRFFLSGMAAFLAFNTHTTALLCYVGFPVIFLFFIGFSVKKTTAPLVNFCIGFAAVFVPVFLFNWIQSGYFVIELESHKWAVSKIQRATPMGITSFWAKLDSSSPYYSLFGYLRSFSRDFLTSLQLGCFVIFSISTLTRVWISNRSRPLLAPLANIFDGSARSNALISILVISLYLSFEFLSYLLMRKLPRYFSAELYLLVIPVGALFHAAIAKRAALRDFVFTSSSFLFLFTLNVTLLFCFWFFLLYNDAAFTFPWQVTAFVSLLVFGFVSLHGRIGVYDRIAFLLILVALQVFSFRNFGPRFTLIPRSNMVENRYKRPALYLKSLFPRDFRDFTGHICVNRTRWLLVLNYYFEFHKHHTYGLRPDIDAKSLFCHVTQENIDKISNSYILVDNALKKGVQSLATKDIDLLKGTLPEHWWLFKTFPLSGVSVYYSPPFNVPEADEYSRHNYKQMLQIPRLEKPPLSPFLRELAFGRPVTVRLSGLKENFGTIPAGGEFEVSYKNDKCTATGKRVGSDTLTTQTYGCRLLYRRFFSIWGPEFKFDLEGIVYRKGIPIGRMSLKADDN